MHLRCRNPLIALLSWILQKKITGNKNLHNSQGWQPLIIRVVQCINVAKSLQINFSKMTKISDHGRSRDWDWVYWSQWILAKGQIGQKWSRTMDKDWKINSCILCCLKVLDSTLDLQFRTKSSFFQIITLLEAVLSHYDQIWSSILGHMGVLGTGASLK